MSNLNELDETTSEVFEFSDGHYYSTYPGTPDDCDGCAFEYDSKGCFASSKYSDCVSNNIIWIKVDKPEDQSADQPTDTPEASKTPSEVVSEATQGVGSLDDSEGSVEAVNQREADYIALRQGYGIRIDNNLNVGIGTPSRTYVTAQDKEVVLAEDFGFTVNDKGGMKHEVGKLQPSLLLGDCKDSVEEVIKVLQYGANKYSRKNWALVTPEQYKEALLRHVLQFVGGETKDKESGLHHLAHAVCCALFIQELTKDCVE